MTTKKQPPFPGAPYNVPDHPLSQLFPMMDKGDAKELGQSIEEHGLREEIVLLDGLTLDGRNRLEQCREVGFTPRFRHFDPETDGDPLEFVMDKNMKRRHLTTSQRAAVAAELAEMLKRSAAQTKAMTPPAQAPDEFDQRQPEIEPAPKPAAGAKKPATAAAKPAAPKTPAAPKPDAQKPAAKPTPPAAPPAKADDHPSRTAAAKTMKVSTRAVAAAAALKKSDPKKFEDVKKGKATLNAATTSTNKAKKKAEEYEEAMLKIRRVMGQSFYDAVKDGTRLKGGKREVFALAALTEDEMLKIRGLLEDGWTVDKAVKYKAAKLCRTHKIGDLLARAAASGGMFTLEIDGWDVCVTKKKGK